MITISLISQNQLLDLNPDTSLSVEFTNPFFAERGSSSLPLDIPASSHNLRLLQFPGTLQAAQTWNTSFQVLVSTDVFQSLATLKILALSHDNISVSILFAETAFYNAIADTLLPDIFSQTKQFPLEGRDIYTYLALVGHNYISDNDIAIFPVQTDRIPLNNFDTTTILTDTSLNLQYHPFIAASAREITIDDTAYNAPPGFGIAPFLYLKSVLLHIFSYYGYSMIDTDLFNDVVVPNTTADAILDGNILYSRLLPTVSISDFLFAVRSQFAADFFILPDATVKWYTLNDIFSAPPSADFSEKLAAPLSLTIASPQAVQLLPTLTNQDTTLPVNSYDALKLLDGFAGKDSLDTLYRDCRDTPFGPYNNYLRRAFDGAWIADNAYNIYIHNAIPVYAPDGYTPFTPTGDFSLPTMIPRGYGTAYFSIPYIGNFRHIISTISVTNDDETKILETNSDVPVMFLFDSHGTIDDTIHQQLGKPFNKGTTFIVDDVAAIYEDKPLIEVCQARSLAPGGPFGTFSRLYSLYDEILRLSWHKIKASLSLQPADLLHFSFNAPILLHHQPVMPVMLQFTITHTGISAVSAECRTIKPYNAPRSIITQH